MKGVIFLSGLAGLVIFGPPVFLKARTHHHHKVTVAIHEHEVTHSEASWEGQDQCRFEGERSFTAQAGSLDGLRIKAGSGSLEVVGVEGLSEVQAVARACASHEEFLDDLRLTSDTEGSTLAIETHYPDWSGWNGGNRYARLDLRIEVPTGMAAEIQDGSGEVSISNTGSIWLEDGSGEAVVHGIRGDLTIEDGSGELVISDVSGTVSIRDGSGEIVLANVGSDVEIHDSSGELEVSDIGGSLTLHDGSGEVEIHDVVGTVRVVGDSSGDISVDGVGGDFIVESDGSGGIEFSNVRGTVDIPKKKRGR